MLVKSIKLPKFKILFILLNKILYVINHANTKLTELIIRIKKKKNTKKSGTMI